MTRFYFDHNATTPVSPAVAETMVEALSSIYGNPSSVHAPGQLARRHLEDSRRKIASFIGASPAEIVFTSGGTESNHLAIFGLLRGSRRAFQHIVTTVVEHPAVLEPIRQLEREGVAVTHIPVNQQGRVNADAVCAAIGDDTVLVSLMHANNEVGTLQPVAEVAARVAALRDAGREIYLHSDGVQALGKIPVDVNTLGVDLYSMSAHKLYAPKGIGALYVRKGVPLRAIQFGGRHERERRAGTENVPGAMAFARAVQLGTNESIAELRDHFELRVRTSLSEVTAQGDPTHRLPNTSNLLFGGVSGESLVIALDMRGFAVSSGAACSSGSIEPSPVLLAMGLSPAEARSCVRFSLGAGNTREQVDALAEAVVDAVDHLRSSTRDDLRGDLRGERYAS